MELKEGLRKIPAYWILVRDVGWVDRITIYGKYGEQELDKLDRLITFSDGQSLEDKFILFRSIYFPKGGA